MINKSHFYKENAIGCTGEGNRRRYLDGIRGLYIIDRVSMIPNIVLFVAQLKDMMVQGF